MTTGRIRMKQTLSYPKLIKMINYNTLPLHCHTQQEVEACLWIVIVKCI